MKPGVEGGEIFVVIAHRGGDMEYHSYPAGAATTLGKAQKIAEALEQHRGGKYACSIWKFRLDCDDMDLEPEIIQGVPVDMGGGRMTEREMVEFWKLNEKPFGLCPKECQEWLRDNFSGKVVEYYSEGWEKTNKPSFHSEYAYRLPADYEPAKVGRWVEYEVIAIAGHYCFVTHGGARCFLTEAPGMVWFGGVRYEGDSNWDSLGTVKGDGFSAPKKPVVVRFWVEEQSDEQICNRTLD